MNPYTTLGLNEGCSAAEVKKAYQRLAAKYHPDKNKEKDANQKFQTIKEAYEFLTLGVSSTGLFDRPQPKQKPRPPPGPFEKAAGFKSNDDEYDDFAYADYRAEQAKPKAEKELHHVTLSIQDLFSYPAKISIPKTGLYFRPQKIAPEGIEEVVLMNSSSNQPVRSCRIKYKVVDPKNFYTLVYNEKGQFDLHCKKKVSIGQILSEQEISLPKVNPFLEQPKFNLFPNGEASIIVPGKGLRIKHDRPERTNIIVHLDIESKSLEQEDFYILLALKQKLDSYLATAADRFESKLAGNRR